MFLRNRSCWSYNTAMGLLSKLKTYFGRKFHLGRMQPVLFNEASFVATNYRAIAKEGYQENVYVHAAIREIASTVAGIPWILTRASTGKEIEQHELLDLLRQPNPLMSGSAFFEWMASYFFLAGNSFIISTGMLEGGLGKPKFLELARPDLIGPIKGDREKPIAGYRLEVGNGRKIDIAFERVLHQKTFNPLDKLLGHSPTLTGARSITQSNESKRWNVAMLQNNARPPGGFFSEGTLTEAQIKQMRDQLDLRHAGPENAGRPLIGGGGMKWTQFGLSPTDMDWLEGQKISAREIALLYGVPPELLGDSANKTYSNYKEARKSFYEETILPYMIMVRLDLNNWLVPQFGTDLFLDFNTEEVSALQEDVDALFKRANESNFLTVNEKREMVGIEAVPEGDVVLQPLTLVPLGTGRELISNEARAALIAANNELKAANDKLKKEGYTVPPCGDGKAFNLRTQDQKLTYWKTFDRRRFQFFDRATSLVAKQLLRDFSAGARAVAKLNTVDAAELAISEAVRMNRPEWEKLFRQLYITVGDEFAQSVFGQLKAVSETLEAKQEPVFRDLWLEEIDAWLAANSTVRILGIQDTSILKMQDQITLGIEAGEGIAGIAKRIADVSGTAIPARATLIARTEVISASNLGSQAAATATQLPLRKEWIATPDERVREAHMEADGDIVKSLDSNFFVDGEELLFPGDTSQGATGKNIFNCRCTVGYLPVEA